MLGTCGFLKKILYDRGELPDKWIPQPEPAPTPATPFIVNQDGSVILKAGTYTSLKEMSLGWDQETGEEIMGIANYTFPQDIVFPSSYDEGNHHFYASAPFINSVNHYWFNADSTTFQWDANYVPTRYDTAMGNIVKSQTGSSFTYAARLGASWNSVGVRGFAFTLKSSSDLYNNPWTLGKWPTMFSMSVSCPASTYNVSNCNRCSVVLKIINTDTQEVVATFNGTRTAGNSTYASATFDYGNAERVLESNEIMEVTFDTGSSSYPLFTTQSADYKATISCNYTQTYEDVYRRIWLQYFKDSYGEEYIYEQVYMQNDYDFDETGEPTWDLGYFHLTSSGPNIVEWVPEIPD